MIDKTKNKTAQVLDVKSKNTNERKFLTNIHRKNFFNCLKRENINIANILLNKNRPIRDYHKFNLFLRKITSNESIPLYECIIFLEEEYTKFKKIISMLDQENQYRLKDELSKKFRIKIMRTKLSNFLEESFDK